MTTATAVRERPILFSGEMVRAILEGRKTQTRRVVKPQAWAYANDALGQPVMYPRTGPEDFGDPSHPIRCPFGPPGQRLWVRETFCDTLGEWRPRIAYRADGTKLLPWWRWTPSIHMPRSASRIALEITDVRVERMQDGGDREFWGEEQWAANPWVWVLSFRRIS